MHHRFLVLLSVFELLLIVTVWVLSAVAMADTPVTFHQLWMLPVVTGCLTAVAVGITWRVGLVYRGVVHKTLPNVLACGVSFVVAYVFLVLEIIGGDADALLLTSPITIALDVVFLFALGLMAALDEIRDRQVRALIEQVHGPEKAPISAANVELVDRILNASDGGPSHYN